MLEIRDGQFYLHNKKFNIYSGAIHYFRMLPEYWEDRLTKLKLAGFNTVETYVCWNLHEPRKGSFDFDGMLDIEKFIGLAEKLGLYVIVRPSPYICAEWDFGGLPAWLLAEDDMRVRCYNPKYLRHVEDFYKVLLAKLMPHQITQGGNIIAMQIENEYGSYGNDGEYLAAIKACMTANGIDVLLFTSDGPCNNMLTGGTLPEVYKTVNFGSRTGEAFEKLKEYQSDKPLMCMEFWNGWFDHWGEEHHSRDSEPVVQELKEMLSLDANVNFYMFHGGTNFGFNAGANYFDEYQPTITSYDDDALLNEWGGYTPKYHAVRKVLLEHRKMAFEPLPQEPARQSVGKVKLMQTGSLMGNLDKLGTKFESVIPLPMEKLGQNFGFVLYHTRLKGAYDADELFIHGLHDRAYVFIDGKYTGVIDRNDKKHAVNIPAIPSAGADIDILVEAMGRVNYGLQLHDRKGILESVSIGFQILYHWDIYSLPLEQIESVRYDGSEKLPVFLKGEFTCDSKAECFVHLDGFTKGCVFVNGFNLGRYWSIGPQKSLYLPGALLQDKNEIVVLELEHFGKPEISILDTHDIG